MPNNYYEEILIKINQNIINKNWEQALKLVIEELNVTYIPKEYEQKFQKLYSEIILNINKISTFKQNWSIEKITENLDVSVVSEELQLLAIHNLRNVNVRLILESIKNYLSNSEASNLNKTEILLILKEQAIDQEIKVVKDQKSFYVNPITIIEISEQKLFQAVLKILKDEVDVDNPGTFKICYFLLDNYFNNLFPVILPYNHKNAIAAAVYIRACSLQFIKVTLIASAKQFHTTTSLIKKYLKNLNQYQFI